jgi:predicted DNA-binding transcriptional regulator AlpA
MDNPTKRQGTPRDDLFAERFHDSRAKASEGAVAVGHADILPSAYAEASQPFASRKLRPPIQHGQLSEADKATALDGDIGSAKREALSETYPLEKQTGLKSCRAGSKAARTPNLDPESRAAPRMMTVSEVANYLAVSISKVWRLTRARGDFPDPIRIGGSTRWDRRVIDRYLDGLQISGSSGR